MIGLRRHIVRLVEHCPEWAARFAAELRLLQSSIGDLVMNIEHVGSTAVPDLPAKPILDIAFAVRSQSVIPAVVERLTGRGYIDRGDGGGDGGYLLVKDSEPDVRTVHLHIVEVTDVQWRNYLHFRNSLRSNPALREQYAELKHRLAEEHPNDRQSYTSGKHDFIRSVLGRADWRASQIDIPRLRGSRLCMAGPRVSVRTPRVRDWLALGRILRLDGRLHEWGVRPGPGFRQGDFRGDTLAWCEKRNSLFMAIVDGDGLAIGCITLGNVDEAGRSARIGYWLGSDYWGRGYCKEAFALVLWLARRLGIRTVSAGIRQDNIASLRLWSAYQAETRISDGKVQCSIDLSMWSTDPCPLRSVLPDEPEIRGIEGSIRGIQCS